MPVTHVKSYQFILFDWDGCLANTLGIWFNAIKSTLLEFGISPTDRNVVPLIGDLYKGALNAGIKPEDYIAFKDKVYLHITKNTENVVLYDGAEQLLKDLKAQGKTLALISSGSRTPLNNMLVKTGLKVYFDLVISGSDVERRKPDPEGIYKALEKLGSEKHNAIMVGDSEHDLMAAKNAGIDSILFYPDSHTFFYDLEHLKKSSPTYTIKRFDELRRVLEQN